MVAPFVANKQQEIEGIALATGISVGELWVLNMMYEITGTCTSFIIQVCRLVCRSVGRLVGWLAQTLAG